MQRRLAWCLFMASVVLFVAVFFQQPDSREGGIGDVFGMIWNGGAGALTGHQAANRAGIVSEGASGPTIGFASGGNGGFSFAGPLWAVAGPVDVIPGEGFRARSGMGATGAEQEPVIHCDLPGVPDGHADWIAVPDGPTAESH